MIVTEPQPAAPKPKRRWFHPTPDRFVIALLAVEGLLFLDEWFRWLPKGWPILIAIAAVAVVMVLMVVWLLLSLLFRWRFQYSLRTLLVFMMICAIPCSWLAVRIESAKRQREAIQALSKLEVAWIWYDCHYENGCGLVDVPLRGPGWLRELFGDDFFNDVARVNLTYTTADDLTLLHLHKFRRLRSLLLDRTRVSDSGLTHLAALRCLEHLSMNGLAVTDDGLVHLEPLANLRVLDLGETRITDAGLEHLKGFTQLKELDLWGTQVTDKGAKQLQQALPNCQIKI